MDKVDQSHDQIDERRVLAGPDLQGPAAAPPRRQDSELPLAQDVEPREDSSGASYSLQSEAYSLSAAETRAGPSHPVVSMIGWGWEELLDLLRRANRLTECCVLWHYPKVSFDVAWDDPEQFARQFAIWTTTYALAPGERAPIREGEEFRIERYLRPGRLLSLHSQVVAKEGGRFFLMLDLLAPHDQLDKVMMYLNVLLHTGGVRGGGFVIRTSRSFHFIGRRCVDAAVYRKVLDLVLKSGGGNGIVDVGYCAHTLARELETGLRLQPAAPEERLEVVAELPETESDG